MDWKKILKNTGLISAGAVTGYVINECRNPRRLRLGIIGGSVFAVLAYTAVTEYVPKVIELFKAQQQIDADYAKKKLELDFQKDTMQLRLKPAKQFNEHRPSLEQKTSIYEAQAYVDNVQSTEFNGNDVYAAYVRNMSMSNKRSTVERSNELVGERSNSDVSSATGSGIYVLDIDKSERIMRCYKIFGGRSAVIATYAVRIDPQVDCGNFELYRHKRRKDEPSQGYMVFNRTNPVIITSSTEYTPNRYSIHMDSFDYQAVYRMTKGCTTTVQVGL